MIINNICIITSVQWFESGECVTRESFPHSHRPVQSQRFCGGCLKVTWSRRVTRADSALWLCFSGFLEVVWRLREGSCDPCWLGSPLCCCSNRKKLVCIFLFPVKPNTQLPSHTAPTLIDICDRSGTQLLHSELIFQIEFKWWSWCRINSVVQRPLRATAWTRLYLASQPDSQPTVHAPCHDPGRGHGSECLPNGFGSRGHGVWLFVNSLPDKKFKTCSRNIYAQIILSNEITFHESGQMIFLFVRIRIKSFIAKRWADLQH